MIESVSRNSVIRSLGTERCRRRGQTATIAMKLLLSIAILLLLVPSATAHISDSESPYHDILHHLYGPFTTATSLDLDAVEEIHHEVLEAAHCGHGHGDSATNCTEVCLVTFTRSGHSIWQRAPTVALYLHHIKCENQWNWPLWRLHDWNMCNTTYVQQVNAPNTRWSAGMDSCHPPSANKGIAVHSQFFLSNSLSAACCSLLLWFQSRNRWWSDIVSTMSMNSVSVPLSFFLVNLQYTNIEPYKVHAHHGVISCET